MTTPKIIMLGAGASGATAANELAKQLHISPQDITILETSDHVGGKLKSVHHPDYPNIVTELGAGVLAHNYPIIDVLKEKDIKTERLLIAKLNTVEFFNELWKRSIPGMVAYVADFAWQNVKFATDVWLYNKAWEHLNAMPPQDQEKPFATYAKEHGLDKVATFLKFLWPGFGYGPYTDKNNYAYRVLNYMGYTTIPAIALMNVFSLQAVNGGYQQVVEKMLEGFNVQTSAHVKHVERNEQGVTVEYEKDHKKYKIQGDMLVLACSPYYWKDLGMKLSKAEQDCVDQLSYYRYPVVVCRIKGLKPEQTYFLDALEEKGFGHPAFIFTRDNRENIGENDGRLCTVYINLPEGKNDFSLEPGSKDLQTIVNDLKKIPGVTDVKVEATKVWPDYNPSVPWEVGIQLQKDEETHKLNTLHVGAYLPGSFETVAGVGEYATHAVKKWLGVTESKVEQVFTGLKRAFQFFTAPKAYPVNDDTVNQPEPATASVVKP